MELLEVTTDDDESVYVDTDDGERGSAGDFQPVYADAAGTTRWGYRCEACESFDNAIDTMGRIVCNECPNVRKPDEWDAAHE